LQHDNSFSGQFVSRYDSEVSMQQNMSENLCFTRMILVTVLLLALLVPMSGCQQRAKGQQSVGVEKVKK